MFADMFDVKLLRIFSCKSIETLRGLPGCALDAHQIAIPNPPYPLPMASINRIGPFWVSVAFFLPPFRRPASTDFCASRESELPNSLTGTS